MTSKKKLLSSARVYLILDKGVCKNKKLKRIARDAIRGGVDLIQYRDKTSCFKEAADAVRTLLKITRPKGVPLIVNDRLDVVLATDADGIHVGQEDVSPALLNKILEKTKIVGYSCHSARHLKTAAAKFVDYYGFGPVFATRTKRDNPVQGSKKLKDFILKARRPVFAIGGITEKNLDRLIKIRRLKIAVCRDLCLTKNIKEKISNYRQRIYGT